MINILLNTESRKDANVNYILGYAPEFCILAFDDKANRKCLFVASFERDMYKGVKCYSFNPDTFRKDLHKYFKRNIVKVGINEAGLSVKGLKMFRKLLRAKTVDISSKLMKLRLRKTTKEIQKIKTACHLTDKIFGEICILCKRKKFATECDINNYILKRCIDLGVEPSFSPVVASGSNGAKPHHIPGNKKLKGFTVIDFGVKYKSYCSDMTRMIYFGNPSKRELFDYEIVLNAQENAIKSVKKGMFFFRLDKNVRNVIGNKFIHALGHGIGVEIHEPPSVSPKSKDKIESRMVFTIEPGLYVKGRYGIRIEDAVVFSGDKAIRLTRSSKRLVIR